MTPRGGKREGAGRKLGAESPRIRVTIRLSPAELARIKELAAQAGVSYNEYMRRCALHPTNGAGK
jgi:predicted DNA binding CopG/RHH family protein